MLEINTNYGLLPPRYKICCFEFVQGSHGQDMVRFFIIGTIAEEGHCEDLMGGSQPGIPFFPS
jgi:hypothetical protein